MKHLTRRLIILPIIIFIISVGFIFLTYFLILRDFENDLIKYEHQFFLNEKKKEVKDQLNIVKHTINSIIDISYSNLSLVFKDILYRAIKEYKNSNESESFLKEHFDPSHFFFAIISKNYNFPKNLKIIDEGKRKFGILNGKKYFLVYEKIDKNKIFAIAIKNNEIERLYLKEIKKILDEFNKNRVEYIAMGKITTFNPKDGNFGKIIYMPPSLRKYIGKVLNYNKKDIKGKEYRKVYFDAFKNGKDEVFESYYFKNPKTLKYEKKYSYVSIIRPYNYTLVKGFYESEIKSLYEKIIDKYKKEVRKVLGLLLIVSALILIFGIFLMFKLSNDIIKKINIDYESLKNELFKRFYYDDLTGVFNRNKLLEDIDKFSSLILVDIYDFSALNEIYGFEVGDKILKYFANKLKNCFENVYRIGSDEFAIGFSNVNLEDEINKIFSCYFKIDDIKIDIEIGASNIKPLLQTSEIAQKEAQKNNQKYVIYDKLMYKTQKERLEKIALLKEIYQNDGILPYYHCITDKNKNVIKYEALMRLKNNDKIYAPFEFIDLLKETNLYYLFSKRMIEKVFDDVRSNKIDKVSINLSFEDIINKNMRSFILSYEEKILKKVTFEILESEEIKDYTIVSKFLTQLKNKGSKIAIDDFGSGYSNLVEILKIKPDFIKIDGSLIKNLNDEKYFKIVKLIEEFCEEFNIYSVAEFVEDEEIFNILKKININYFQGYYFCKPSPLS